MPWPKASPAALARAQARFGASEGPSLMNEVTNPTDDGSSLLEEGTSRGGPSLSQSNESLEDERRVKDNRLGLGDVILRIRLEQPAGISTNYCCKCTDLRCASFQVRRFAFETGG